MRRRNRDPLPLAVTVEFSFGPSTTAWRDLIGHLFAQLPAAVAQIKPSDLEIAEGSGGSEEMDEEDGN